MRFLARVLTRFIFWIARSARRTAMANLTLPMVGVLAVSGGIIYHQAYHFLALVFVQQMVLWYGMGDVMLNKGTPSRRHGRVR